MSHKEERKNKTGCGKGVEDNGKSNFCITKQFALFFLQAENFDIAWVATTGENVFLAAPQAFQRMKPKFKAQKERIVCTKKRLATKDGA